MLEGELGQGPLVTGLPHGLPSQSRSSQLRASTRRKLSFTTMNASYFRPASLTPLIVLQTSALRYWLDGDDELRALAKLFTVHSFGKGETLPKAPICLVMQGKIDMQTDNGVHWPATHEVSSCVLGCNALDDLDGVQQREGRFLSCLLCTKGNWDEDEDEEGAEIEDRRLLELRSRVNAIAQAAARRSQDERQDEVETETKKLGQEQTKKSTVAGRFAGRFRSTAKEWNTGTTNLLSREQLRVFNTAGTVNKGTTGNAINKERLTPPRNPLPVSTLPPRKTMTKMRATEDGEALLLTDLLKLASLRKRSPAIYRAVYEVCTLETVLLQLPLFSGAQLSGACILLLRDLVSYRTFPVDTKVNEEYSGDALFIVMQGAISVRTVHADQLPPHLLAKKQRSPVKRRAVLGSLFAEPTDSFKNKSDESLNGKSGSSKFKGTEQELGFGQTFGGTSLFLDARPQAQREVEATVTKKVLLACLPQSAFDRLLEANTRVSAMLTLEAKRRLLFSFRSSRIPFYSDLSDTQIQKFAELATLRTVDAYASIDTDGAQHRGLYIVADGEVDASCVSNDADVDTPKEQRLTPAGGNSRWDMLRQVTNASSESWRITYGHYFGEVGLMLPDAPLKMSYKTPRHPVQLLVLSAEAFGQLFGKDRVLLSELRMKVHREVSMRARTGRP